MNKDELQKILREHLEWLHGDGGKKANLQGADLRGADLYRANLQGADLRGASLRGADLQGADLYRANLQRADLQGADLRGADLRGASLRETNLSGAYLQRANLWGVDALLLQCPEKGGFTGYKKLRDRLICELYILPEARRSSATTRKCRCDKAKVLSIIDENGTSYTEGASIYDKNFTYKVGEIVEAEDFDEDRWNECSTGIHFFITKQEAIDY